MKQAEKEALKVAAMKSVNGRIIENMPYDYASMHIFNLVVSHFAPMLDVYRREVETWQIELMYNTEDEDIEQASQEKRQALLLAIDVKTHVVLEIKYALCVCEDGAIRNAVEEYNQFAVAYALLSMR